MSSGSIRTTAPRDAAAFGARALVAVLAAVIAIALLSTSTAAAAPKTKLISKDSSGVQGGSESDEAAVSANGRFVAFASYSKNLVPGDANNERDIFLRDRKNGTTTLISRATDGTRSNGESLHPALSANGRYIVFASDATNLIAAGTNGFRQVYVHDRKSGRTKLVSKRSNGVQGDDDSRRPDISASGRFVAFESDATNLVNGDTKGQPDVFVRDRKKGKTRRVSLRSSGKQGNESSQDPSISANGRFVAFASYATNLVHKDTNGVRDIFVRDRKTGKTRRVSLKSDGKQANGESLSAKISGNGRFVAFSTQAKNLAKKDKNDRLDVYVHDRQTGKTRLVSQSSKGKDGNGLSREPAISASGRFVVFTSGASNFAANDTNDDLDVFVHDRNNGKTRRLSIGSGGALGNGNSGPGDINADGRVVVFESYADNLIGVDGNSTIDVFSRAPLR